MVLNRAKQNWIECATSLNYSMTVFSRDGSQHECEGKITPKWLQYTVLPHGDTTGVCGEKVIVCSTQRWLSPHVHPFRASGFCRNDSWTFLHKTSRSEFGNNLGTSSINILWHYIKPVSFPEYDTCVFTRF